MINLNPRFCLEIRDARKAARISQSELAAEVGCKQSALSMFEQGDGTKLNDEVVKRLATKFSIKLPTSEAESPQPSWGQTPGAWGQTPEKGSGFCPNVGCPSHLAYEVDGRKMLKPDRAVQDPVGGRFCAICGEVLERKCPTCGSAVHEGAICSFCGVPYIASGQ